ncbi:MAG: hypothetical protein U5O39_06220 [Gammaproteobacteria bacterium]|nr:hypothetical protein [Gammaproteobacteria bacterium]
MGKEFRCHGVDIEAAYIGAAMMENEAGKAQTGADFQNSKSLDVDPRHRLGQPQTGGPGDAEERPVGRYNAGRFV